MNFFGKGMAERMKGGIKWAKIWSKCNLGRKPPPLFVSKAKMKLHNPTLLCTFFTKSLINALFFPIFDLFYVYGMNQTSSVSGKPKMPKMQISLINYMSSWDRDVDRTQTFPLIMPFGSFRMYVCVFKSVWRVGWKKRRRSSLPLYKSMLESDPRNKVTLSALNCTLNQLL